MRCTPCTLSLPSQGRLIDPSMMKMRSWTILGSWRPMSNLLLSKTVVKSLASVSEKPPELLRKRGRRWTRDDEAHMVAEYRKGISIGDIASKLARTSQSVVGKLYQLGVPLRARRILPWTTEDLRIMEHSVSEGQSFAAIAKLLGRTELSVLAKHKTQGQVLGRFWTELEVEQLTELKRQQATIEDICAHFPHRSRRSLVVKAWRLGRRTPQTVAMAIPWSSEEAYLALKLRDRYKLSCRLVASLLGTKRSTDSVATKIYLLKRASTTDKEDGGLITR